MSIETSVLTTFLASFAYFLGLSFSIHVKKITKKLIAAVLLGTILGISIVSLIVAILIFSMHYDQLPLSIYLLVCAPIAEESSKLVGIFFGILVLSKIARVHVTKLEAIRLGGGIGLGFGALETLSYIMEGATIARLLVSVPFHISSAMLIGFGLDEKSVLVRNLFLAFAFHSASNFLARNNVFLQGFVSWIFLLILYFLSENRCAK